MSSQEQADALLQESFVALQSRQLEAALPLLEQALAIYRERAHRRGEGIVLGYLGTTHRSLRNYTQAIAFLEQGLAVLQSAHEDDVVAAITENLAMVYDDLGEHRKAIEYHQHYVAFAQMIRDQHQEAAALNNLGFSYDCLGESEKAIDYCSQSLAIAQTLHDTETVCRALGNIGNAHRKLGDMTRSTEVYLQLLTILHESSDSPGEVQVLYYLGNNSYLLGDYRKAIEYSEQSFAIARSIDDHGPLVVSLLNNLGHLYYRSAEYRKAISYLEEGLVRTRALNNGYEAQLLLNLGNNYAMLGDRNRTIECYEQGLASARSNDDHESTGQALNNLGNTYYSLAKYDRALAYLEQSKAIAESMNNPALTSMIFDNMGLVYHAMGNYPQARTYLEHSLTIAQQLHNRSLEWHALNSLGLCYTDLGNFAQALAYYEQGLASARACKEPQGEGMILNNLGSVYRNLQEDVKSIDYFQQSLTIARQCNDMPGEGKALGNLGNTYRSLDENAQAIAYHQQSLTIARQIKDPWEEAAALNNLGLDYEQADEYATAIEWHEQALQISRTIGSPQGEGKALGNIGNAHYFLGHYSEAVLYQKQSLALAQEIGDWQEESISLSNLGAAFKRSGKFEDAEKTLLAAVRVLESIRTELGSNDAYKISIFEGQARTYRLLQEVLIAQENVGAALEAAERGRTRTLVELLTRRYSSIPIEPTTRNWPTIDHMREIASVYNAVLVEYSIMYDSFLVQGKRRIQEAELFIWVIDPKGTVTFRRVDLAFLLLQEQVSLSDLVRETRVSIGVRGRHLKALTSIVDRPSTDRRLQLLHSILIQPIHDLLERGPDTHIIFIPQGDLFLVPFAALRDADHHYFIEEHVISIAPSIQVLDFTYQQRQHIRAMNNGGALVVGDPIMPEVLSRVGDAPEQLLSLPHARQEAIVVAQLLKTRALVGEQATKKVVVEKMPQQHIIHLATHGLLDDIQGSGIPGAIALAPGEDDNGLLTAREILDLNLSAELVVLSACDTGQGQVTGDGIIGLSRSFMLAGVPTMIVSLWSVPDAPTAFLMETFYRNLGGYGTDKAQALRQAMLATMRQHPDPKDWAAFTLVGEVK